jgi:hypothetical protein
LAGDWKIRAEPVPISLGDQPISLPDKSIRIDPQRRSGRIRSIVPT